MSSTLNSDDAVEILITGMAGKFPKSENVQELAENLYNKVDMLSNTSDRIEIRHPSIPVRMGICANMEYFDAQFFAVNYRQARHFETMTRKLLEVACEAIIDSGINPRSLRDSNTGVFIGTSVMESEAKLSCNLRQVDGYGLTGTARTMMANRISYWLGARGPSYTVFGEDCSSALALVHAFNALATGQCDAAVVGGTNLCLEPTVAMQVHWLNFSTFGTKTKCFCEDADGSVRSDAIVAIFLQKAKDAKRVYAKIVYAKSLHTGLEIEDNLYTHPSGEMLGHFLREFYSEVDVKPEDVEYVEACGTAIKKADYEELQNIDEIFCSGQRSQSLMVGSVTSNVGHTESASTLVSIVKVCLAYNRGMIAGNLHLDNPRKDIFGVQKGRIRLLDDNATFRRGYAGINSFTYGGICGHFLLENYNCYEMEKPDPSLPYLVCAFGRVEKSIDNLFDDLENKPLDAGQIALLHNLYDRNIPGFVTRGYNILTTKSNTTVSLSKKSEYYDGRQRPVCFVYSGMGSQWPTMGAHLMRVPVFAEAVQRCHDTMLPFGVDLVHILTSPDPKIFDNIMHSFVGIAAVQIGLTDVLKAIGIEPDYIIGHSVGELGCAYADGCVTAEEMLLAAYYRGLVSVEIPFIHGSMAAVGLGYNAVKSLCPTDIAVACHNGPESSTLSGPADSMKVFVEQLKKQGKFAKEVACSNIAYHSKYIANAGPALQKYMSKVIKNPKSRSSRWISSSVPQSSWDEPNAKLCSAEYLTNNLLNPVLFDEASRLIPSLAITIEIAPHGLLQAILKRSLPKTCIHVPLTRRGNRDNVLLLLESIGELCINGLHPQLMNLYPAVNFPVPPQTPLLSHTIAWEHSEVWSMFPFDLPIITVKGEQQITLTKYDKHLEYLKGHVINGVNILPAAAQLVLVWETLAKLKGRPFQDISVIFKNIRFESDVIIPEENSLELTVMLQKASGNFEIILQNATISSGQILAVKHVLDQHQLFARDPVGDVTLTSDDIYRLLTLRGYRFSGDFKSIRNIDSNFTAANVVWKNNWVTFIDSLIQIAALKEEKDAASKPKYIDSLEINVNTHRNKVTENKHQVDVVLKANYYKTNQILRCAGVQLVNLVTAETIQDKVTSPNTKINSALDNFKLQVLTHGDYNSLTWLQTPEPQTKPNKLVQVHYTRVGYSDLMLAQGRTILSLEQKTTDDFGTSFSGISVSGDRLMGVVDGGSIASVVEADDLLTWSVPEYWSLEEAASVPQAYVQALYILIERAQVKPNSTVLVTQGSGALGQAIISVCLSLNCKVFTTLRYKAHKTMLMKVFPELNEDHIFILRYHDIVETALKGTCDEGYDLVISSVDGNERQVLMSCVAALGSFIDISLQDMTENAKFGMSFLWHGKSYKAVNLSNVFRDSTLGFRKTARYAIHKGICEGWVKPIPSIVYQPEAVSRAFCVLNAKRNFGAVLLNMRNNSSLATSIKAVAQWRCNKDKSYIIVCDYKDLGVELVDKLVQLGAKNIVVHAKTPNTAYSKIKMRSVPGVNLCLSTDNLATEVGCKNLISTAAVMGQVTGLFIVTPLRSGHVDDNPEVVVRNLDYVSRSFGLEDFIILTPSISEDKSSSSVFNILKEICMDRINSYFTGRVIKCTAIQNDNYEEIEVLTASLNEILKTMETSMLSDDVIVTVNEDITHYQLGITDIIDILGLSQSKDINLVTPLNEMQVQISKAKLLSLALKQYNHIFYTPEMLMKMTLTEITEHHKDQTVLPKPTTNPFGMFFSFYDNDYERTSFEPIMWMPTLNYNDEIQSQKFEWYDGKDYMIVLPGMEGLQLGMIRVCRRLKLRALVYQYIDLTQDTVQEMAAFIIQDIKKRVNYGSKFYLIGYSFGVLLALEMAAILEKEGNLGKVFCLDASPSSLKIMLHQQTRDITVIQQQNYLLQHACQLLLPNTNIDNLKSIVESAKTWDLKVEKAVNWLTLKSSSYLEFNKTLLNLAWKRILQTRQYIPTFEKLNSELILIRGNCELDYGLAGLCKRAVKVYNLNSEHNMVPYNLRCSDIVNRELTD